MNELRMYVERLFEGKVLTEANIELKEEIYGNLVARYEDLVASGVPEEDALEQTKASFTSVDDVLSGDEALDGASAQEAADVQPTVAMGAVASAAAGAASGETAAKAGPTPPEGVESASVVTGAAEAGTTAPRKKWPIVLGVVAGIVVIAIVSQIAFGFISGPDRSYTGSTDEVITVHPQDGTGNGATNGNGSGSGAGNGSSNTGTPSDDSGVVIDSNGAIWCDGDPADGLLKEVVDAGASAVKPYVGITLADAAQVEDMLRALPLGTWAEDVDVTKGDDTLSFAYRGIPGVYDDESEDIALAYNVTSIFCAMPQVSNIWVTVYDESDLDDDADDEETYLFTRADVERDYGVPLNGDMVNQTGWKQIKHDNLYTHDFAESMVDRAEGVWK